MDRAVTFDNIKDTQKLIASAHRFKSGYIVRPHWHDFFELEVLLFGKAKHLINGSAKSISSGDAFIITQNEFHSIEMLTDTVFLNISFSSFAVDKELMVAISSYAGAFCAEIEPNLLKVLQNYASCNFETLPFSEIIKRDITEILLADILKKSGSEQRSLPHAVRECVSIINLNFRNEISLEQAARQLYLSPNYLGVLFKNALGCSFRQYLNRVRLRYACNLLTGTEYSVKETAALSGYASTEYFTYAFKEALGTSPALWRKQHEA